MEVQNCIKMMFFGSVPGFVKGSGSFMAMLENEGQTIQSRLNGYNLLKKVILGMKDDQSIIGHGWEV